MPHTYSDTFARDRIKVGDGRFSLSETNTSCVQGAVDDGRGLDVLRITEGSRTLQDASWSPREKSMTSCRDASINMQYGEVVVNMSAATTDSPFGEFLPSSNLVAVTTSVQ
jgi:hypothetical protein